MEPAGAATWSVHCPQHPCVSHDCTSSSSPYPCALLGQRGLLATGGGLLSPGQSSNSTTKPSCGHCHMSPHPALWMSLLLQLKTEGPLHQAHVPHVGRTMPRIPTRPGSGANQILTLRPLAEELTPALRARSCQQRKAAPHNQAIDPTTHED